MVAGATVLVTIPLATVAAYSFSRFRLLGGRVLLVMILATPVRAGGGDRAAVFLFFYRDLGLLDSRLGLVLIYLSLLMPFAVWMIKGFYRRHSPRHRRGRYGGRFRAAAGD